MKKEREERKDKIKISNRGKKAISPIITTILLVLLVVVVAAIILLWGFTFIPEVVTKFDRPIEEKCAEVNMRTAINADRTLLSIVNQGDIGVYKISIKRETSSNSEIIYSEKTNLKQGATNITGISSLDIESGDKIYIIPVLLGKDKKGGLQEYPCPESSSSWQVIEVA